MCKIPKPDLRPSCFVSPHELSWHVMCLISRTGVGVEKTASQIPSAVSVNLSEPVVILHSDFRKGYRVDQYGGFHSHGGTQKWMVYKGKPH